MSSVSTTSHPGDRSRFRGLRQRRSTWVLGIACVVFAVSFWQNLSAVTESQIHPDESRWLNRSHYLEDALDPTGKVWIDRYLTRGQPPLGSYVTGLGLLLQGRDLTTNGPWDFHYGNESATVWNNVKGNLPDVADLMAARRTNAVIGALTCLAVFLLVTYLTNMVGGVLGALFLAFHPLQIYLSSIGVSDALFTFLVAVSALAGLWLAIKPTWPRAMLLGVVLGCGAATKLSPLIVAAMLAAGGGVILLDPYLRRLPFAGRLWRLISRVETSERRRLGWMLIALPAITFATFVSLYPYLWSDPIGRSKLLVDFRRQEMDNQARIWPASSVDSRFEALQRTWRTLENSYGTSARFFAYLGDAFSRQWGSRGIDLPLALAGLGLLVWLAWRRGIASPQMISLALLGGQSAVILTGLRVDFNRYYIPLVLVCAIGVGVLSGLVSAAVLPRLTRSRLVIRQRKAAEAGAPPHDRGREPQLGRAGNG